MKGSLGWVPVKHNKHGIAAVLHSVRHSLYAGWLHPVDPSQEPYGAVLVAPLFLAKWGGRSVSEGQSRDLTLRGLNSYVLKYGARRRSARCPCTFPTTFGTLESFLPPPVS